MKNQKILALLFIFWVFGCLLLLENNDLYINQDAKYKRNTQPLHLSNNFLTREWNYTWGGAEYDYAYGVAVDSLDNIYVTGDTSSFGALYLDIFLLKYNSMGVLQWNYTWGGAGKEYAYGVAVDSLDNIYVTGYTSSFGTLGEEICLLKFNSMGVLQWNYTWGGAGYDFARGLTIDSSDNIYITGITESFGALNGDICLLKFNSMGVLQWNYTWGGAGYDSANGVALDSLGNIYITGVTDSFGVWDICLLKFNSMGVLQWNYTWGGAGSEFALGLTIDSSDNIYITGSTSSFGALGSDICLLKYNAMGTLQCNSTWGGTGNDSAYGVALDSLGNIYITGSTSIGWDIFLVKFNDSTPLPDKEDPLVIILIAILSTAAGIGVTAIAIGLLRKRKHAIPEE
ncbi:hypothetical protein ES705_04390 [subsurface metagenome]